MVQTEATQPRVMVLGPIAHLLPQAPQLLGSFPVLASQPSPNRPLQSLKPLLQVEMPHVPPRQIGVALATLPQGMPQPPQLARSLTMLVSQPLPGLLSQSANPLAQLAMMQTPLAQAAPALGIAH